MLQTNKKVKKRKKIEFVRFHQLDQDSTNNNHFLSFDHYDVSDRTYEKIKDKTFINLLYNIMQALSFRFCLQCECYSDKDFQISKCDY